MKFICLILLLVVNIQHPVNANSIANSNINTLFSLNEFTYLNNPFDYKSWDEGNIRGSIILSWKSHWTPLNNAFGHILLYLSGEEGGRLEIKLIHPTFSDSDRIEGIWCITRNRNKNRLYGSGIISGLNQTIGQIITFSFAEKILLQSRISFLCAYHSILPEITGQIMQNGQGINDARVTLIQKDEFEDTLPTYGNGNYSFFLVNKDNLEAMRIRFFYKKEPLEFSGNIYILGTPWQNARAELRMNSIFIDEIKTDQDGFFHFSIDDPGPADTINENQEIDILLKAD